MSNEMSNNNGETKVCKKCHSEIPKKAKICPKCRSKQKTFIMPIIIGVVLVAMIFAGLGGSDDKVSSSLPIPEATDVTTGILESGLNEAVNLENLKVTALEIQTNLGSDFAKPKEDNMFIGVKMEVENTSDKEQSISSMLLFDSYVDDIKSDISLNALLNFTDGTLDGLLEPGKKMVGWVAVEGPSDSKTLELSMRDEWLSGNKAKFKIGIQ